MSILCKMAAILLVTALTMIIVHSICFTFVSPSRADLGTYLHIKDIPVADDSLSVDTYVLAYMNYTYISPTGKKEFQFSEEKARYGEGKILDVQGLLVHITSENNVNDHTGCMFPLRGSNGNPIPGPGKLWIALIKRGLCTFEDKIKHAWRQGAVGVIVYNEEPSITLEKMKINEKERNITAVFTYKVIGEELGKLVDKGLYVWMSISEGQRGVKPMANINKTSVLFVSISFIVLMIISLVWLIFYYVQRFRYLQSKDQHSRHLCSVAKRIIMRIPTKSGKNEDKDSESDCCAICIEPYKATDCIRVLPCNHEFHKNCIDPWLLEHRTCPMCKLDVLKHYGFVFIGSQESIMQLDLDAEIGGDGLHSSEDDPMSIDNIRVNTTPTFHIQNFSNHNQNRRTSSPESQMTIERDIPERSQSSLSHISPILDEAISNKLMLHSRTSKAVKTSDSKLLCPHNGNRDLESISLPGTLRKMRATADSCRGSNNCYIKPESDSKSKSAKIEKGCPKSRTSIVHQKSDDEQLLCSEKTEVEDEEPSEQPSYVDITIQIEQPEEDIIQE